MCLAWGVLWSPGAPSPAGRPRAGRQPRSQRTGTKASLCGARQGRMCPGTQPGHCGTAPCPLPAPPKAGTARAPGDPGADAKGGGRAVATGTHGAAGGWVLGTRLDEHRGTGYNATGHRGGWVQGWVRCCRVPAARTQAVSAPREPIPTTPLALAVSEVLKAERHTGQARVHACMATPRAHTPACVCTHPAMHTPPCMHTCMHKHTPHPLPVLCTHP